MSLDNFKKYTQETTRHSESKIKRSRSMLKLLESKDISSIKDIQKFINAVEVELGNEAISNIFNTRLGVDYAHTTARDLFNCLKSMKEEFDALSANRTRSKLITIRLVVLAW